MSHDIVVPGAVTRPSPATDGGPTPMTVSSAGEVLTSVADRGLHGEVVLVSPDGSVRVLYDLPAVHNPFLAKGSPELSPEPWARGGQIEGRWAVFGVGISYHHGGMIVGLVAVDLDSGIVETVRAPLASSKLEYLSISYPVLLDGAVYWSETSGDGSFDTFYFYDGPSTIYRLDLATKHRSTVAAGIHLRTRGPSPDGPALINGAVNWVTSDGKQHWHGTPAKIPGFPAKIDLNMTVVQDGPNVAWTTASDPSNPEFQDTVFLGAGGETEPQIVYKMSPDESYDSITLDALSGPYLIFDKDPESTILLDIRTGATATVDSETDVMAGGGVIVLDKYSGDRYHMALIRTDTLPELHC